MQINNVKNAQIIVFSVKIHSNVKLVLSDSNNYHKKFQDRKLSAVIKFVEMVLNMNNNVMMEIKLMVMVVVLNVKNNMDGSVQVVHQVNLAHVRNIFLIVFNFHPRVLSI